MRSKNFRTRKLSILGVVLGCFLSVVSLAFACSAPRTGIYLVLPTNANELRTDLTCVDESCQFKSYSTEYELFVLWSPPTDIDEEVIRTHQVLSLGEKFIDVKPAKELREKVTPEQVFEVMQAVSTQDLTPVKDDILSRLQESFVQDINYVYGLIIEPFSEKMLADIEESNKDVNECVGYSYQRRGELLVGGMRDKPYCEHVFVPDGSCGYWINSHPLSANFQLRMLKNFGVAVVLSGGVLGIGTYLNGRRVSRKTVKKP